MRVVRWLLLLTDSAVLLFWPRVLPALTERPPQAGWAAYASGPALALGLVWVVLALSLLGRRAGEGEREREPAAPESASGAGPLSQLVAAEREIHEHHRDEEP